MRTLAFLLLFCTAAYAADTVTTNVVGDITTKISERTDGAGKLALRIEASFRGKKEILQVISGPDKQGKPAITSRAYFVGGKLVMVEAHHDGEGVFGEISVECPGTDDFELFNRQPDGSLKPVSTKQIELRKKQYAVVNKSVERLFSKKSASKEDLGKALEETRRKVWDLGQQENDVAATNIARDIRTSVSEHPGKDGKPEWLVETMYRGKSKILQLVSHRNKKGEMAVISRTYSVDGKSLVTERDDNGDGLFEDVIVFSPDADEIEIFTRHSDGTVTSASTAEIDLVKKETAAALEPLGKLSQNPNMSDVDFGKSIEESRQKIQDIKKAGENQ